MRVRNILLLIGVLVLSGCFFNSPTRVADKYFDAIYDSDNYKIEVENGGGIGGFIENLSDRVEEMKEITEPYVTEEQSDSILGGLKLVVTSVIFTIVENEFEFNVEETEYSLRELDSDDNNKYYDYLVTIKLVDSKGEEKFEDFKGVIHIIKEDNKWRINEDRLLIYDLN
ncbi:hypothetical protein RJG79_00915 [Mycoplasmatota bacterium WC44]